MSYSGLNVLVTGGASGIGQATVERLARHGGHVAIGDINREGAETVARELNEAGGHVTAFQVDVGIPADVERFVRDAYMELGGINGVVSVAGLQISSALDEQTQADWDRQMAVNARAPWLLTKYALAALRERGGAIVHVASLAGIKGFAGVSGYSASKGAVVALTRASAVELAPNGIRVNCVCPGWVDTPFNDPVIRMIGGREALEQVVASTVPLGRQSAPAEIAPAITFLLSDESSYITGQLVTPDGGSSA